MRCKICTRPDAKAINLELLSRGGRRTGVIKQMAERLGVDRTILWRHRKEHLKIFVSKGPVETKHLSFEERARELGNEANRLQLQAENGAPRETMDQAFKGLAMRVKLLEMESRFAGRPLTQRRPEVSLEDPDDDERARKEFAEVVGEQ
jgi:hypothetical protein